MQRTLIALVGIVALTAVVSAQSNEEKYKKKLEKEFTSKVPWVQSLTEARAKAAEEKKIIFGYFTRSYSP